ncbi:hypothetical protein [Litoribacterium kuwaitense]|nr:hypothetical protein [Litoribacterium kuwaitense]
MTNEQAVEVLETIAELYPKFDLNKRKKNVIRTTYFILRWYY